MKQDYRKNENIEEENENPNQDEQDEDEEDAKDEKENKQILEIENQHKNTTNNQQQLSHNTTPHNTQTSQDAPIVIIPQIGEGQENESITPHPIKDEKSQKSFSSEESNSASASYGRYDESQNQSRSTSGERSGCGSEIKVRLDGKTDIENENEIQIDQRNKDNIGNKKDLKQKENKDSRNSNNDSHNAAVMQNIFQIPVFSKSNSPDNKTD
ncbi:MAG: hypothetical protein EZS28_006539 [Streblomastix strix]|uniref:Uncharacterized protein n=1 Tax=Streblomastix strix TaxID=222440 RepID=A0A5J4WSN1_9EUKA|nr:MAG: hypothetical protein EZS28_006539 [Streblomastix strix]